jgi:hypothetical protein
MKYIYFKNSNLYSPSVINSVQEKDLILIPPNNTTNINNYLKDFVNIYKMPSKVEQDRTFELIHRKIQIWIANNYPSFDQNAIKLCTFHLAQNYSMLYSSTRSLVKNIANLYGNKEEYLLICDYDLFDIPGDWHCPLISLISAVEYFSESNINFKLIGCDEHFLEKLLSQINYNYSPFKILNSVNSVKSEIFFESIENSKLISYHLSGRNNIYYDNLNSLNILSKSNIISGNYLGSYNQFTTLFNPSTSLDVTWKNYSFCRYEFSKLLESLYFNTIGNIILPCLFEAEIKYTHIFERSKNLEELIIEEAVDLESLPLISAASKSNKLISISQHSTNALIKGLTPVLGKECIAKKIYANSHFTLNQYSKLIDSKNIKLIHHFNNIEHKSINGIKNTIIIIENDIFRKFGYFEDLSILIAELSLFISLTTEKFNFIWRQRTNEFSPVYEFIRILFPNLDIIFDHDSSLDELSEMASFSIGVGTNSSMSYQLISKGVINFFISSKFSDWDYVPKVNNLHLDIGPLYSANSIINLASISIKEFEHEVIRQQQFLSEL